jgi:uncharacterized protein (DUF779 family)
MSESILLTRITATPEAREAIRLLRAAHGGPVMFVQSDGCYAAGTTFTSSPVPPPASRRVHPAKKSFLHP